MVVSSLMLGVAGTASALPLPVDTGITTDTGDLAHTPPIYTRFPEPLACIGAMEWMLRSLTGGTLEAQAQQDTRLGLARPEDDTLPTAALATAQACGGRFTLANTPSAQWRDLFVLSLLEGKDTLAKTVLTKLLAEAGSSASARGDLLLWATERYLAVKPARLAAAEAVVAQLDAMGQGSAVWAQQQSAHDAMFKFALLYSSWPLMERYGAAWIAFARDRLAGPQPGVTLLVSIYRQLLEGAFVEAPDSVSAVANRLRTEFSTPVAQQILTTACSKGGGVIGPEICHLGLNGSTPIAQILSATLPGYMRIASPAPRLHADFWFPPPGSSPGDTIRPVQGPMSIIYRWVGTEREPGAGCEEMFENCRNQTNVLKGLLDRYGPRLAGTVVVDASGFTVLHVPASPAEVAQSYRWYFQQFLKLPVAVAVRMRPVAERRPPPDGRIVYSDTTSYRDVYSRNLVVIVGRRKQILYQVPSLVASEVSRINHVIAREDALQ